MYCDWPTLGRCCFCMPLRKGVLTFGYINLIISAFMVGVYSYSLHIDFGLVAIYHATSIAISMPESVTVATYCLELIFSALLLYGIHKRKEPATTLYGHNNAWLAWFEKLIVYIKMYYYFAITTTVATALIQLIAVSMSLSSRMVFNKAFEVLPLLLAAVCIQVYLLISIRSLLKKMEGTGPHVYENQLQQIVYEGKVESNGVYDPTVVPVDI